MPTEQQPDRRRTSRVSHKVRVILSGKDADGIKFAEETDTVNVNKHGASVRTSYTLSLGQEISVRIKEKDRAGQFEVVYVGKERTSKAGLVGLEWVDTRRFWGIDFPPEDWGGK